MKRLFFALWPDEETRQKVDQLNQQIKGKQLKKCSSDNLHMTLVFLGNTSKETELAIKRSVKQIVTTSFEVIFDQVSFWKKPHVLCLTGSYQPALLLDLVNALKQMAVDCGINVESRPYKAHITLARKAQEEAVIQIAPVRWRALSFALVESVSTNIGVQYKVIKSWPIAKV